MKRMRSRHPTTTPAVIAAVSYLIVTPGIALAQGPGQPTTDSFRASTLYSACTHLAKGGTTQDEEFAEQTCVSYLRGLTDALLFMQSVARRSIRTCMPEDSPVGVSEARRIFESYLSNHSDQRVNSAGVVAGFALLNAYKCGR